MTTPWEKYQTESGPWSKYQTPEAPKAEEPGFVSNLASLIINSNPLVAGANSLNSFKRVWDGESFGQVAQNPTDFGSSGVK